MKILYVTTVGKTMSFFLEHIKMLREEGHIVELAANFSQSEESKVRELGCVQYDIPFSREVCRIDNLKAYFEMKQLLRRGDYDIVHTHTPNASVLVRLAGRKLRMRRRTKIFYTAHGFHFYKGAPLKNWLLFFSAEKICAHWTDVLITINREDYALAKRHMKAKKVEYVPGVGIDIKKFQESQHGNREELRKTFGAATGDTVLLSVGELNRNKNHETVIKAIGLLRNPKIHYVIAGVGERFDYLQRLAEELEIKNQIHLLGYRDDVADLYRCSNIYILPSLREGLNVSLMEAMASGLPCIVSRIRGNTDLILEGKGGIQCKRGTPEEYASAVKKLLGNKSVCSEMGNFNRKRVNNFSNHFVLKKIGKIYADI